MLFCSIPDKFVIECILENFCEQNCLWVRFQYGRLSYPGEEHFGATASLPVESAALKFNSQKTIQERTDLQVLIGANLQRLSELLPQNTTSSESLYFKDLILPGIFKEVLACHDPMSQHYIMMTFLDVFPVELYVKEAQAVVDLCKALEPESLINKIFSKFLLKITDLMKMTSLESRLLSAKEFHAILFQGLESFVRVTL